MRHLPAILLITALLTPAYARSLEPAAPARDDLRGVPATVADRPVAGSPAGPAETLTVEDVVRLVLARNSSLKEVEDAVDVFKAKVDESRAALLPGVRGEASYARIGPVPSIDFPGLGNFQLFPANNYDIHTGLRQMLHDGKRTRTAIDLAGAQVEGAQERGDILKRDLEFQAAQFFYTILFLQESIRVQNDHLKTLDDHLAIARKKLEIGTAVELEVLNTQVRIAAVRNQITDLENALEKQQVALRRLAGLEGSGPLTLKGEFARLPHGLDPEVLVPAAMEKRPEGKALANLKRTAEIQAKLAGLHDAPVVSVNLSVGAKNGYIPDLNPLKLNFVAAIEAVVPIFEGHLTRSMKAEAAANLKTVEDKSRELEDLVRSEVEQAISDVTASERKLETVEVNIEQARKALAFAKARYEAGTLTNLEVLDTEEAHTDAEFMKLQALYKLVLSRLSLRRAAGEGAAE